MAHAHFWHVGIELMSAILLAVIAHAEYQRYRATISYIALGWAIAFGVAAGNDLVHAAVSFAVEGHNDHWMPWTWATGRFALIAMLCFTAYTVLHRRRAPRARGMACAAVVTLAVAYALPFVASMGWVNVEGNAVPRPVDLALALMYLGAAVWLGGADAVRLDAPRYFSAFLVLGAAAHFVMAVSSDHVLDPAFMIAHMLKICEYALWAVSLGREDVEASRLQGGHRARLQIRATQMGLEDAFSQLSRRFEQGYPASAATPALHERRNPVSGAHPLRHDAKHVAPSRTGHVDDARSRRGLKNSQV